MSRFLTAAALAALLAVPVSLAIAQTAAPVAPAPAAAARAPAAAPALPAGRFHTDAEAKAHCPTDVVVWATKEGQTYHTHGERLFGKTKLGAFMCKKDAEAAGLHAPRLRAPAAGTQR